MEKEAVPGSIPLCEVCGDSPATIANDDGQQVCAGCYSSAQKKRKHLLSKDMLRPYIWGAVTGLTALYLQWDGFLLGFILSEFDDTTKRGWVIVVGLLSMYFFYIGFLIGLLLMIYPAARKITENSHP